ncbi:MAG: hypothetical protein UY21_C0010G0009 [Microgenomates group bacterium GW2011_GWA1_48_10]|nr:MAG: hypothetical protein UY21_C0010G0009 [Microgenomates group bacterium GW2011_GWA1_48_10]
MNISKDREPRFWKRWQKAGAVGTIGDAKLNEVRTSGRTLPIVAVAKHYSGPAAGDSVVGLGEKVINEGTSTDGQPWKVTAPEVSVVVKGHGWRVHDLIQLPRRARALDRVFPKK